MTTPNPHHVVEQGGGKGLGLGEFRSTCSEMGDQGRYLAGVETTAFGVWSLAMRSSTLDGSLGA